ncbi:MAG: U32 family peptidase [Alphaproteobacteria bacterium]|nr:U32 family peptidase [Alphaproteobacteria bacterium]
MKKPELLLPAGSPEAMQTAFLYGADAVYCGLPSLSLRAGNGFDLNTLAQAILQAHKQNKKVYLTLNLFSRNSDIERLADFAETVNKLRPDGLIISDPGVFMFMKEHAPDIPLHVSTQANVGSWLTVDFWRSLGAKVCVLSRETPFEDICEIKRKIPDMKIEMFIHGAMCMSYSGRCLLSSFMTGRSANRGKCAHACRWKYKLYLEEEQRPGEFLPIEEDDRGTYILNSKDLCLMPCLNKILEAGIDLLKVEGRNKTPYYVAQTARAYRHAIDDWFDNPRNWRFEKYQAELDTLQNRGYTTAFFNGVPDSAAQNYETTQSAGDWRNAGVISAWTDEGAEMIIYQKIEAGDTLYFLPPDRFESVPVTLLRIIDGFTKKEVPALSPGRVGQSIFIPMAFFKGLKPENLPVFTVARTKLKS